MSLLEELEDLLNESKEWRENAERKIEGVLEKIVEDKVPYQLFDVAKAILLTSSDMSSLKSHQEDFERLLDDASSLVVVLWQTFNNESQYRTIWPPSKWRKFIDKLVETVDRIHKLMERKCKNFVIRTLVGCFGIRDLGKFKRYQRKLNHVAAGLKGKPNNVEIIRLLQEVIDSRPLPDDDAEESVEDDTSVERGTKERDVFQEPTAEGSRLRKAEKSTVKPANQKVKHEDVEEGNQTKSKTMARKKAKANDDSDDEGVEKHSAEDKPARKKTAVRCPEEPVAQPKLKGTKGSQKVRHSGFNEQGFMLESEDEKRVRYEEPEDLEEGTSAKASRTKNPARSKTMKSQAYEGDEHNSDVPVRDPVVAKKPLKKKPATPATTNVRSQTAPASPASPPSSSISGYSFNNTGSGTMRNENVGNIYNSNISDVNNDNSVNHFYEERRRPQA